MGRSLVGGKLGGGTADTKPVDLYNPLSQLQLRGIANDQRDRDDYLFPLPEGAKMVKILFHPWGYSGETCMWLFLQMKLFTWENREPRLFSDIPDKVSTEYGTCSKIEVVDGVLNFRCCCPSVSERLIRFFAYG